MWKKGTSISEGSSPANKATLDKLGENNGVLTFDGKVLGSSGSGNVPTVTADSSGFFYQRENLHDIAQETSGSVNSSDGTITASGSFTVTPHIPVTENTTYISTFVKTMATYDTSKVFKGMINTTSSDTTSFNAPRAFVMPAGVAFVRYTRGSANTNPMFVKGAVLPLEYLTPGIKELWIPQDDYVKSMRRQLNPLYGLKWIAFGDSVTRGEYPDPVTGTVISYHQAIASKYGVIVDNQGIGGTKITASADNKGFCQRYTSMSDTADIVTVMGIINDYASAATVQIGTLGSTDTSTIYGAMKVLCEGLLLKYPTQKLGFIIPYPFNEYKGAGTFKPYYDALVASLNYYSIPYLDLYKNSRLNANIDFINTAYFKDGDKTHPNTKGHEILAKKIHSFLLSL